MNLHIVIPSNFSGSWPGIGRDQLILKELRPGTGPDQLILIELHRAGWILWERKLTYHHVNVLGNTFIVREHVEHHTLRNLVENLQNLKKKDTGINQQ